MQSKYTASFEDWKKSLNGRIRTLSNDEHTLENCAINEDYLYTLYTDGSDSHILGERIFEYLRARNSRF